MSRPSLSTSARLGGRRAQRAASAGLAAATHDGRGSWPTGGGWRHAGAGKKEKGQGLGWALIRQRNKAAAAAKERGEALAFGRRRAMPLESIIDVRDMCQPALHEQGKVGPQMRRPPVDRDARLLTSFVQTLAGLMKNTAAPMRASFCMLPLGSICLHLIPVDAFVSVTDLS